MSTRLTVDGSTLLISPLCAEKEAVLEVEAPCLGGKLWVPQAEKSTIENKTAAKSKDPRRTYIPPSNEGVGIHPSVSANF